MVVLLGLVPVPVPVLVLVVRPLPLPMGRPPPGGVVVPGRCGLIAIGVLLLGGEKKKKKSAKEVMRV